MLMERLTGSPDGRIDHVLQEFSRKVMTYSRNQRTIQAVNLPDGCWNSGSCGGSTQMLIEMVLELGAVVLNCRDLSVSDHESVVAVNIFLALPLLDFPEQSSLRPDPTPATRIDPAPPPAAAVNRPASPSSVVTTAPATRSYPRAAPSFSKLLFPIPHCFVPFDSNTLAHHGRKDYILDFNANCERCVVSLSFYKDNDEEKKETYFATGIIFASGKRSCCVLTTIDDASKRKDESCVVKFFDGTSKIIDWKRIKVRPEFKCATIYIHNIDMIHGATVTFSDQEIDHSQKVFTVGYNTNQRDRTFISGNLVNGVGIRNKDAIVFVHGCSTGNSGHLGSAVFNENKNLVGMNVSYTRSRGTHYISSSSTSTSDYGGIVSALNLQSIQLGLSLLYKKEGETIGEIVRHKRNGPKNVAEAAGVDLEAAMRICIDDELRPSRAMVKAITI
uniref:Uncharacterized protein n=1 Tax=Oryza nivara TaxID=4536 RepID=A0A0E0IK80_ORYNI